MHPEWVSVGSSCGGTEAPAEGTGPAWPPQNLAPGALVGRRQAQARLRLCRGVVGFDCLDTKHRLVLNSACLGRGSPARATLCKVLTTNPLKWSPQESSLLKSKRKI